MVQLILHCNYTAFAHMATEIRLLPKDRHVPSLITEQTRPKGIENTENRKIKNSRVILLLKIILKLTSGLCLVSYWII